MLKTNDSFLVVIDVQGNLAQSMHERDAFLKNLKIAIQGAIILDIPIIWVEQIPEKLGATTPDIAELLAEQSLSPLAKSSFSVWGDENIQEKIKTLGRKQALLCGIESHVCVYQSCRDLIGEHYEVHLISDAIASRSVSNKEIGLAQGEKLGAQISSVEMALFDLVDSPENPAFRSLVKIMK